MNIFNTSKHPVELSEKLMDKEAAMTEDFSGKCMHIYHFLKSEDTLMSQ